MDERRLKQREEKIEIEKEKIKKESESFKEQYADLKSELSKVSYEEWQSIPEAHNGGIKKQGKEKYTPVPDSMIVSLLQNSMGKSIEPETNKDIHDAKEMLLKTKLQLAENSAIGKSQFDKIGYLTQLSTKNKESDFLGDVKRARVLLKSALNSNSNNADIWVSAARVEEIDGKIQ